MRPSFEMRRRPRPWSVPIGLLLTVVLAACSAPGTVPSSAAAPSPAPTASATAASPSTETGGGRGDYDYIDPMATESAAASDAPAPAPGTVVQVTLATGPLGAYLTGLDGLTLYTFKPAGTNTSTCDAGCAEAWPPFTVAADATLEGGDGVDGDLTTFARADGSLQVAYEGAPLYYFANDTSAGDTNGQGLGDNWFVAKP